MTGKQRVLATLRGEIPDRVPWGEFAIDFDTVEKILGHETYLRAKAKSQLAFWEGRHDEVAESYLKDHIALHEKLELDIVTFPAATSYIPPPSDEPPPRRLDDETWEDRHGRIYKYSPLSADITCVHDPVADAKRYTLDDFAGEPRPPARNERGWAILDAVIQRFKHEKFICGLDGGEIGITLLGGMERGLLALAEQPEVVEAATRYRFKQACLADDAMIHPDMDATLWGADFGFKTGPLISPRMFRAMFKDTIRARVAHLHQRYGIKVMKHCCGNINSLIEDFVEIGYDAYQSIQPTAGMDIGELKQRVGDRLTLWGGVAVELLMSGTPSEVRAEVRRAMELAKPGGRFILGSSHSIAVGTRYDNFMAMVDEYHKLRAY